MAERKNKTKTTWCGMRYRCHNPNNKDYKYYGARGIVVCKRWHSYANFVADMGERPEGHTLDRIDPDGNYEPGNCRWLPAKLNSRHKRSTTVTGEIAQAIRSDKQNGMRVKDIATKYGISRSHAGNIAAGRRWSDEF